MIEMTLRWPAVFDPNETKDYTVNWTDELNAVNDTISSANDAVIFTPADAALVAVSTSIDSTAKKAVVWFTAGDLTTLKNLVGTSILVDHVIKTTGGRVYNETIALKIKEK